MASATPHEDWEAYVEERDKEQLRRMCDCERSANGLGLAIRECDCGPMEQRDDLPGRISLMNKNAEQAQRIAKLEALNLRLSETIKDVSKVLEEAKSLLDRRARFNDRKL